MHYPRAIHEHPAYATSLGRGVAGERAASREVLSLPLYPELPDDEAAAVVTAVREACGG